MMINKRLIGTVRESKKYIALNVVFQWLSLIGNMAMMTAIAWFLTKLFTKQAGTKEFLLTLGIALLSVAVRYICARGSAEMAYQSSKAVKKKLRQMIYEKLLRLGASYREKAKTSEVVQVAVEGVEQLETYFGAYLPQFFYAILAPLTLFVFLCFVNVPSAVVLFLCVPLIPITIAGVQTWAKKLFSKYWGQYTAMGDSFLENLQGLTTLKIYQSDAFKNEEMNEEAEKFRVITMRVLTMQLNSITIMDLIAYGGAAAGVILAAVQLGLGRVDLPGSILIILLSADFFLPMRQLGSFFHVAMNGMAASDKIFHLLDVPEPARKNALCPDDCETVLENVSFSYEEGRNVLENVSMTFPAGSFTAIVGESGCGKSTVSNLLMGRNKGYTGKVTVGGMPLSEISEESLMKKFTYISNKNFLFKGTVRDTLLMGNPAASEKDMWDALEKVKIAAFLKGEKGLDTLILDQGSNLSGGQCQRLSLARALLHNSSVYIFDEATSNIDVESETDIMAQIHELARKKTVILISHRLMNVVKADHIYVMEKGRVAEEGNHQTLLEKKGVYKKLWDAQQTLENYAGGAGK